MREGVPGSNEPVDRDREHLLERLQKINPADDPMMWAWMMEAVGPEHWGFQDAEDYQRVMDRIQIASPSEFGYDTPNDAPLGLWQDQENILLNTAMLPWHEGPEEMDYRWMIRHSTRPDNDYFKGTYAARGEDIPWLEWFDSVLPHEGAHAFNTEVRNLDPNIVDDMLEILTNTEPTMYAWNVANDFLPIPGFDFPQEALDYDTPLWDLIRRARGKWYEQDQDAFHARMYAQDQDRGLFRGYDPVEQRAILQVLQDMDNEPARNIINEMYFDEGQN